MRPPESTSLMDEPTFLLRAVTWHFGSGDAFFVGWGLVVLASALYARGAKKSRVFLVGILALIWLILADVIPVSPQFRDWVLFLAILRILVGRKTLQPRGTLILFAISVAPVCISELFNQWPIQHVAPKAASVAIIGDSVTAGLNAGDHTWPRQLAEATGRTVYDASQQGATVKSALTQLEKLDGRGDVLWIEIGGNDILESLPSDVYAERLDELLAAAMWRYKQVVLMEIPAPPGGGRYGATQRRLAAKYRLPLVPKRQFVGVLTSKGGTQDGVHLANAGHQQMAEVVQRALGWPRQGAGKDNGPYLRCE